MFVALCSCKPTASAKRFIDAIKPNSDGRRMQKRGVIASTAPDNGNITNGLANQYCFANVKKGDNQWKDIASEREEDWTAYGMDATNKYKQFQLVLLIRTEVLFYDYNRV